MCWNMHLILVDKQKRKANCDWRFKTYKEAVLGSTISWVGCERPLVRLVSWHALYAGAGAGAGAGESWSLDSGHTAHSRKAVREEHIR